MSFPVASGRLRLFAALAVLLTIFASGLLAPSGAGAFDRSFLASLSTVSTLGSTVPENGDVNPYGIVVVPASTGSLVRGDVLVSNFNDQENEQGTGTTIVQLTPSGSKSLFAQIDPAKLPPGA